jgi:uncharacterized protein (TIGR02996 family)
MLKDAFIRDIREHLDDDTPRLVYADWLDEHGDPSRAEFIRIQCELARLDDDDPIREERQERSTVLEKAHAARWLGNLRQALDRPRARQIDRWTFRRGFLEALVLSPLRPDFLTAADDALAAHPLQELSLTGQSGIGVEGALPDVCRARSLSCLSGLDLCGPGAPTADSLRALGLASHLGRLTSLGLSFTLPAAPVAGLIGTPLSAQLRSLWLVDVVEGQGQAMLDVLTSELSFPALESLGLSSGNLGDAGLVRLAQTPNLPSLQELSTGYDTGMGAPGLASLLASSLWPRLTSLSLSHCSLGDAGAALLVAALPAGRLGALSLNYSGLTAATAAAFLAAPSWDRLEALSLAGNALGDEGVQMLARSPQLGGLRRLDLYDCGVGETGARALAASPHAGSLRELRLYESDLALGPRRALRKRFGKRYRWGHS